MDTIDTSTYLRISEAARYLKCSESRLKDLVQAADIAANPAATPRVPRRLIRAELDAWMSSARC